jgi:hypothetical protein
MDQTDAGQVRGREELIAFHKFILIECDATNDSDLHDNQNFMSIKHTSYGLLCLLILE